MMPGKLVPLIVDASKELLQQLRDDALMMSVEAPIIADCEEIALELLALKRHSISALVVGSSLPRTSLENVIFSTSRLMPSLPIIMLGGREGSTVSNDEIGRLKVHFFLPQPTTYHDILKSIPTANSAATSASIIAAQVPTIGVGSKTAPPQRLDQDFAPVEIELLSPAEQAGEDMYLRVRQDRYIKILRKGFAFGTDRIERYVRRGVKSVYRNKKV